MDSSNIFNLSLKDISIDMKDWVNADNQYYTTNFLKKNENLYKNENNDENNFLQLSIEGKPLSKPHIDKVIDLNVKSAMLVYNPIFINRISKFFQVNV